MATINTFPVNSFYFNVEINGVEIPFQSVSGLGVEHELEPEKGTKDAFTSSIGKITYTKYTNVTLKKGIFTDDPAIWKAFRTYSLSHIDDLKTKLNNVLIKEMFISLAVNGKFGNSVQNLVSEDVVLNWTLYNLVPKSWKISPLDSMNNEFLTETVEFVYEGLVLTY